MRHLQREGREIFLKAASICCGKFPSHDHGMSANEEVRKWHGGHWCTGPGRTFFPILTVCLRAYVSSRCRHIENGNAPSAYPVGHRRGLRVSHAYLGQAHRIDGGPVARHGISDHISCPAAESRVRIKGVDKRVGVQKDHRSRVSLRSLFQVIVGRRGALRMASKHAFLLMPSARFGFSRRVRIKRPSACCWMSKTSPGRPPGSTIRFLLSIFDVLMVGLSHIILWPSSLHPLLIRISSTAEEPHGHANSAIGFLHLRQLSRAHLYATLSYRKVHVK